MLKDITLGQYFPTNSIVHRLDSRIKIISVLVFIIAVFICDSAFGFLLAVFSTILGHSIFSWCLKYFSPAFVSASKLCEPLIAAVFAGILFGEVPSFAVLIGGAMILGGVLYHSKIEREN